MDDMSAYYQSQPSSAHHYHPQPQPPPPQPPQSQQPPPLPHHYTPQPSTQHDPCYPYYPSHPPPLEPPSATLPPQPYIPPPYHHQPQHLTPPPYTASHHPPPARYAESAYDEVRTLFVAGLPEDVNPREIYNLFREFPGYESSHLRNQTRSSLPFAFAVFSDQRCAIGALQALNGMIFDLEKGSTLHIDLAKSNSRSKRSRTDDERDVFDKRVKGPPEYLRGIPDPSVGSIHMPGMTNSAYNMIDYPSSQSYPNYGGRAVNDANLSKSNVAPCPTLFVANLGPTCTEEELIQTFSRCPGFLKLKMQNTYGSSVAFVDFQDTPSSTGARNHLQGTVLYSSPAGEGIRLDYAKTRMGLRKRPQ